MNNPLKNEMWKYFKELGKIAISMSHYDLAENTSLKSPDIWKEFLYEPDVQEYLDTERKLMHNVELNKLIQDVSSSRSVGQAQIINALSKMSEENSHKEGPVFIYTYVPVTEDQAKLDVVRKEIEDIFDE